MRKCRLWGSDEYHTSVFLWVACFIISPAAHSYVFSEPFAFCCPQPVSEVMNSGELTGESSAVITKSTIDTFQQINAKPPEDLV